MDPVNVPAKFEVRSSSFSALPIPEIIGVNFGQYAYAPFSPKFLMGFCSDGPVNVPAKFEVRSFTRS